MEETVLRKWRDLIALCKSYYVDSVPTGISDSEYDELERRAVVEDNFYVRDYVFCKYLKGAKTKNNYIERIKKEKVADDKTMLETLSELESATNNSYYYTLKYDGSSLAIYLDPKTGQPRRVVTVGNLNLENFGVDQTWKLLKFLPKRFPRGIVAIQAEALIDTSRLTESDPSRARQKANGLINSKYCDTEINQYLTLRAFRYYTDDSVYGIDLRNADYRSVLNSFETVTSSFDGHILFCPAQVFTLGELKNLPTNYTEKDETVTQTGTFLNDGWVVYSKTGTCLKALKYSGAGQNSELIKTIVRGIQWNSQVLKGKDSWSANILIDPVTIKGCTVRKPSAGSIGKVIKKNVTPGAEVSIVLANSTIPMIGEVYKAGNGDYSWPICSCGYKMSQADVYGSLLKCGNPNCSERLGRMRYYLSTLKDISQELDLNAYLVIDRFKWETTEVDINTALGFVEKDDINGFMNYLVSFLKTDLQRRNLSLVGPGGFKVLREAYNIINK